MSPGSESDDAKKKSKAPGKDKAKPVPKGKATATKKKTLNMSKGFKLAMAVKKNIAEQHEQRHSGVHWCCVSVSVLAVLIDNRVVGATVGGS